MSDGPSATSDPMRNLHEATAALHEATGHCVHRFIDQDEVVTEWVAAVAHHAWAVDAAVRDLAARLDR